MFRLGLVSLLLILVAPAWAADTGPKLFPVAHITSQTTTTLVSAVAGKKVQIISGRICVDANGATTGITLQSTAGTNFIGTNVVYVLAAGACLWFPVTDGPYPYITASGTGLAIVTTVGSGPVNVTMAVVQQ